MAILTLIYGQSGTGKSTSLRNLPHDKVAVINVSSKPLPFRNPMPTAKTDNYAQITAFIKKTDLPIIVIDDFTYLMVNEFMRNAKIQGYQKFTDLAKNVFDLMETCIQLGDDKTVYLLGHSELDQNGNEKFKTIGKLLDEKVTLEGKCTNVLKTVVKDGKYYFSTHNSGMDTVKTPLGMFEQDYIDNDLYEVDKKIREFWGMPEI